MLGSPEDEIILIYRSKKTLYAFHPLGITGKQSVDFTGLMSHPFSRLLILVQTGDLNVKRCNKKIF
jgi:hypothetical protein